MKTQTKIKKTIYKIWFLLLVSSMTLLVLTAASNTYAFLLKEIEGLGVGYYDLNAKKTSPRATSQHIEKVRVTCFSQKECRTAICQSGEIKRGDVALNPKFGKHKEIYIPKFDKVYQTKWISDRFTDVDIWFGGDYENCLKFGSQYLEVKFLD